ncbi:MAG: short-chain fatty acyl-CoA regulator family protein [Robiginitomaculum sp.]
MAKGVEKLMIGPRIRRLRKSMGLTQTVMAKDLDISTSYLNLIERNQRPMSAKVLLRIADVYDADVGALSPDSDVKIVRELSQIFTTPAYREYGVTKSDIEDCVGLAPDFARAFIDMYGRAQELSVSPERRKQALSAQSGAVLLEESASAVQAMHEFIHQNLNYFDEVDRAAESLVAEIGLRNGQPNTLLSDRLKEEHGVKVRIVPPDLYKGRASYFDAHSGRLNLSEHLTQSGRRFRIAYQLAMLEQRNLIDGVVSKALLPNKEADDLARISLFNYFAAATLMPYGEFLRQAKAVRYDIEILTRRFDTSYEQTAHRLTTLRRKGAQGIPFFFVRADTAGNVTKWFSAQQDHFLVFGGASPQWNVHTCFFSPGTTISQIIEMGDGSKYLSVARAILRPESAHGTSAHLTAVGIGCALKHAGTVVYGNGASERSSLLIDGNCHVCGRNNCQSRAHASINRKLKFDKLLRAQILSSFK